MSNNSKKLRQKLSKDQKISRQIKKRVVTNNYRKSNFKNKIDVQFAIKLSIAQSTPTATIYFVTNAYYNRYSLMIDVLSVEQK